MNKRTVKCLSAVHSTLILIHVVLLYRTHCSIESIALLNDSGLFALCERVALD
ncbi:hypothetical protein [Paenibacillus sp. KS1]|uniref:hypothetical protein n=1 Tax=Paenibacillus sp. KS1 TaxID=1849249 RepID=UPI001586CEB5|nr:hypothetical protein [Paenibacillus sp. KS1]